MGRSDIRPPFQIINFLTLYGHEYFPYLLSTHLI
nr:MAG TPA: hypothetical protein [Caudoviricetes sp.]